MTIRDTLEELRTMRAQCIARAEIYEQAAMALERVLHPSMEPPDTPETNATDAEVIELPVERAAHEPSPPKPKKRKAPAPLPEPLKCPHCDQHFSRQNGLTRHINQTHNGGDVPNEDSGFRPRKDQDKPTHRRDQDDFSIEVDDNERAIRCDDCTKAFETAVHLHDHVVTAHNRQHMSRIERTPRKATT